MFRFNYNLPGSAPATFLDREEGSGKPPLITLISYNEEDCLESQVDTVEELPSFLKPDRIHWINVQGVEDVNIVRKLGELFSIHPLALEDVLNLNQRPKIESYEDVLFVVSSMLFFHTAEELVAEQLSIFLGKNFVLTFQEERGEDFFERIRNRIRSGRGFIRKMQADYLVYAILDAGIDSTFPILEVLSEGLEELETRLMDHPSRSNLKRLYEVKRLLLQVRREVWPHREIFSAMLRDDSGLIHKETQLFLRDCYDHTTQLIDMVESYRDLAAGLMDVYLSSVGMRTNEIMRVLTLVSTFFIPLTFLAGIYGMNFNTNSPFNMPELDLRYGYIYFWVVCVLIIGAMLLFFRRKKWL
jgi:magnesium transporter